MCEYYKYYIPFLQVDFLRFLNSILQVHNMPTVPCYLTMPKPGKVRLKLHQIIHNINIWQVFAFSCYIQEEKVVIETSHMNTS